MGGFTLDGFTIDNILFPAGAGGAFSLAGFAWRPPAAPPAPAVTPFCGTVTAYPSGRVVVEAAGELPRGPFRFSLTLN